MLDITLIIIIGLIVIIVVMMFLFMTKQSNVDVQLMDFQKSFNTQMQTITSTVNQSLTDNLKLIQSSQQSIGSNLTNHQQVVSKLQERLAAMEESNKKIFEVGKDIASLQEILKAPKMRGNLGELFLNDLLAQILPRENYEIQHSFNSNERVDAAIFLGDKLVSVDAKFPLENFKKFIDADNDTDKIQARKQFAKDVKKHVDDIAKKYILPDEGTFDFALMYIPAENIYYETIIQDDQSGETQTISSYAISKKVIPVSPNSFYAYLQAILLGLKGLHVEKSAQVILESLGRLQGDLGRFKDEYDKVGTHLAHLTSSYEKSNQRLGKFSLKLETVQELSGQPKEKLEIGMLEPN